MAVWWVRSHKDTQYIKRETHGPLFYILLINCNLIFVSVVCSLKHTSSASHIGWSWQFVNGNNLTEENREKKRYNHVITGQFGVAWMYAIVSCLLVGCRIHDVGIYK